MLFSIRPRCAKEQTGWIRNFVDLPEQRNVLRKGRELYFRAGHSCRQMFFEFLEVFVAIEYRRLWSWSGARKVFRSETACKRFKV